MPPRVTPPPPPQRPVTTAWAVYAWPAVLWQPPHAQEAHLRHLGTQVTVLGENDRPSAGQTVWGEPDGDQVAGIAWDWIELARGIVAMADPMAVITNVRLLDPQGGVLTPLQAAPLLNSLVHALPWQTEVQRALDQAAF